MTEIPTQRGPWDDDETAKIDAGDADRRRHRNFGGDIVDPERVLPIKTARGDAYLTGRGWPYGSLERTAEGRTGPLPELPPEAYAPDARPLPAYGITHPQQPLIVNVEQPRHSTYVEPPNHVLHGLLTVATGGVWGFVWAWRVRKYRKAMRRANR